MNTISNRLSILSNDTWIDLTTDYNMILMDGYVMDPPEIKKYTVDIPGRNGILDLSDSLTGGPLYGNRKHEFTFAVLNPEGGDEHFKTEIANILHGKYLKYSVTMDPGYIYNGRFAISSINRSYFLEGVLLEITISIEAEPFKIATTETIEIYKEGWRKIEIENTDYPSRIKIDNPKEGSKIIYSDAVYNLEVGLNEIPGLILKTGHNEIWVNLGGFIRPTWGFLYSEGITWNSMNGAKMYDIYNLSERAYPSDENPMILSYERRKI